MWSAARGPSQCDPWSKCDSCGLLKPTMKTKINVLLSSKRVRAGCRSLQINKPRIKSKPVEQHLRTFDYPFGYGDLKMAHAFPHTFVVVVRNLSLVSRAQQYHFSTCPIACTSLQASADFLDDQERGIMSQLIGAQRVKWKISIRLATLHALTAPWSFATLAFITTLSTSLFQLNHTICCAHERISLSLGTELVSGNAIFGKPTKTIAWNCAALNHHLPIYWLMYLYFIFTLPGNPGHP